MTVNVEIPYVRYVGNANSRNFAYVWTCQDSSELIVELDGATQEVGVDFILIGHRDDYGGTVQFATAPYAGQDVLLYRETPVTQQVDYEEFASFPAETHEGQMDKDTRILQEIIHAGRGIGGPVDLSAFLGPNYVDIINTSGTDARIPAWHCMAPLAGVFHGEVTESAPADGESTPMTDGYIWWEIVL